MGAEEESIERAANDRRERLKALRAAQELSSMPDDGPTPNGNEEVADVEDKSIEQAAGERRERLKALREAKELLTTPDGDSAKSDGKAEESEETEESQGLNMKFRNYLPHDKHLQEGKLAPGVLPKFEDPVAAAPAMVEKIEDPFVNIAPKKPNWDLRRDVQKRLDKLERRTQKAIYELMQEQEKEKEAEVMEVENGTNE